MNSRKGLFRVVGALSQGRSVSRDMSPEAIVRRLDVLAELHELPRA